MFSFEINGHSNEVGTGTRVTGSRSQQIAFGSNLKAEKLTRYTRKPVTPGTDPLLFDFNWLCP
jgi:hypothetical protein